MLGLIPVIRNCESWQSRVAATWTSFGLFDGEKLWLFRNVLIISGGAIDEYFIVIRLIGVFPLVVWSWVAIKPVSWFGVCNIVYHVTCPATRPAPGRCLGADRSA